MSQRTAVSRRTMLRGLGATIALPWLEAMGGSALGQSALAGSTTNPIAGPKRLAYFFLPNGMNISSWMPAQTGDTFELSPTLEPLARVRDQLTLLHGLTLDNAWAKGDGPGDHARSCAAFLTGAHPHKTAGADIHLGVSADQVAADATRDQTRLPSLELGLEKGGRAGECDSGYSCAYISNVAWRTPTTPLPHESNPSAVFARLFGIENPDDTPAIRSRRLADRRSILDFVADDARALNRRLGSADQQKLDEFTTSIREVEKRVKRSIEQKPLDPPADVQRPDEAPEDFAEQMTLLCDMLVLAFRMDITRVSTFMVASDGSGRVYRNLGLTDGHHALSHHGKNPQKLESIAKIDRFHSELFARFLQKLHDTREGEKSLLDQSMIVYGCGIADGDRHNHDNLPILLAGGGGGTITPGRQIRYSRGTPLCNLHLSLIQRMGASPDRFGDSTGALSNLST